MQTVEATVESSMEIPQVIKNGFYALGGVAQWFECWPVNQRVAG